MLMESWFGRALFAGETSVLNKGGIWPPLWPFIQLNTECWENPDTKETKILSHKLETEGEGREGKSLLTFLMQRPKRFRVSLTSLKNS